MEDYEERKQAAADALFQYSRFAMVCIGKGVRPCDLRMHLMKGVGITFSCITPQLLLFGTFRHANILKKEPPQAAGSDMIGEPPSSGTTRKDKSDSSQAL